MLADKMVYVVDHERVDRIKQAILSFAENTSHVHAALLLGVALVVVFYGWNLLRISLTLVFAGLYMAIVKQVYLQYLHESPGWIPLGIAACMGAINGWFVYKFKSAVHGALFVGIMLGFVGLVLNDPIILLGLAGLGMMVGFFLGWKMAPWLGALETSLAGGVVAGLCVGAFCKSQSETVILAAGGITAFLLTLSGAKYQFGKIKDQ